MRGLRDFISSQIKAVLPVDTQIVWDNITARQQLTDKPFVKIHLLPVNTDKGLPFARKGEVRFTIAAPTGTGMAYCDRIYAHLQDKLAQQTFGFVLFLSLGAPSSTIAADRYRLDAVLPFISFDANQHAG